MRIRSHGVRGSLISSDLLPCHVMNNLHFKPLTNDDLDELLQWHIDEELSRRFAGTEWPKKLWEILQRDNQRRCWIAWSNGERMGYVDWEMHPNEHLAWIGLAVKPERRGKGWGAEILRAFLLTDDAQAYSDIRAGIEPDNEASVRCFSSAGFTPMSDKPDEEGIVDYVYRRR